jgi:tRNA (uracil-5-)-methyltransferase TRM9
MAPESEIQGEAYEEKNVHEVYQQIANHFSATRYKVSPPAYTSHVIAWQYNSVDNWQPWPVVERFLLEQKPGTIGLDVGCGNGKYLMVNKSVFIVASDRYVYSRI